MFFIQFPTLPGDVFTAQTYQGHFLVWQWTRAPLTNQNLNNLSRLSLMEDGDFSTAEPTRWRSSNWQLLKNTIDIFCKKRHFANERCGVHTLEGAKYASHKTWPKQKEGCEPTLALTSIFFEASLCHHYWKRRHPSLSAFVQNEWRWLTAGKAKFLFIQKSTTVLIFNEFRAPICSIFCTLVGLVDRMVLIRLLYLPRKWPRKKIHLIPAEISAPLTG